MIVTDVEIYLYDANEDQHVVLLDCTGCVKYPKDLQGRDIKKRALSHCSAITVINIYL